MDRMKLSSYRSDSRTDVPLRIQPALKMLLEASQYADQAGCSPWDFSVEMERLTALGLTPNDFRWLVRMLLVRHQREITLEGETGRSFRSTGDLTFGQDSCFILTHAGSIVANELASTDLPEASESSAVRQTSYLPESINGSESRNGNSSRHERSVPTWDSQRRELRINGTTVKKFNSTAINQVAVLTAFEEEGWPAKILDPLPPQPEQCSKRRLSDTIKGLNHRQTNRLIRFRGDGTGQGVLWEIALPDASTR